MNVPWFDNIVSDSFVQKSDTVHDKPKNFVCAHNGVCNHVSVIWLAHFVHQP